MFRAPCLLAVVALSIGVVHCWDFVVGVGDKLMFYTNDGIKTDTVHLESRDLGSLAYDEVYNMILYVNKQNNNDTICGYNLFSKQNVCFGEKSGRNIHSIAYDPVTERLFFIDSNDHSINWISLKRGANNNVFGNILVKMDEWTPMDVAVESCGGYIYWTNPIAFDTNFFDKGIERIRFNGSGREGISFDVSNTLIIDPESRKMYYFVYSSLVHTNLNGKDNSMVFFIPSELQDLAFSKDSIYWVSSSNGYKSVQHALKNSNSMFYDNNEIKFHTNKSIHIATNYKILNQIKALHDCESLSNINAASGDTSGRCAVPVCTNYCLHGNCTVNDMGLPKCRCNAGYSGERCEVSACHGYCLNDGNCSLSEEEEPVCQCAGNYQGSRCEAGINNAPPK